jgi:DNA-binding MarR family transcriptional regulator
MSKEVLDEREFELINIIGAEIGANQRRLSRLMELSLGMTNMLIRRLIAKGFIRIEQLNKRKVQYILTPKGFAEKMHKSVKYTLKTINSIGLIKTRLQAILLELHKDGVRDFFIVGKSDLSLLIEMVAKEVPLKNCSFRILEEIPPTTIQGTLLICKENIDEDNLALHNHVDLIRELAKENHYSGVPTGTEQVEVAT